MKRISRFMWFSVLALAGALPLAGCEADNEAGVASATPGTGDPKYAKGDHEAYQTFAKDQMKNIKPGKAGKAGSKKK
jgi:hypothetical protein